MIPFPSQKEVHTIVTPDGDRMSLEVRDHSHLPGMPHVLLAQVTSHHHSVLGVSGFTTDLGTGICLLNM